MKRSDKPSLSTIIFNLKKEFSRVFGENFPSTNTNMETALNLAAKQVKSGKVAEWYLDNGEKKIRLENKKPRVWIPKKVDYRK